MGGLTRCEPWWQANFSLRELKDAQISATQLWVESDVKAKLLKSAFSLFELKAVIDALPSLGFAEKQIDEKLEQLRLAGFTALEMHDATFSASEVSSPCAPIPRVALDRTWAGRCFLRPCAHATIAALPSRKSSR